MLHSWHAPGGSEELALACGPAHAPRLLVLPAWFDEGNKLRHLTVETMRALDRMSVASVLPDLPGCNESAAPLEEQDLASWQAAAAAAAEQLSCTHVLTIRAAAAIAPTLPGWSYAPVAGKSVLRALLRAAMITAKEAGTVENREAMFVRGQNDGLVLAGYRLGAGMIAGLAAAELPTSPLKTITQSELGGPGLWLRAEPEHDADQAEVLARIIAAGIKA